MASPQKQLLDKLRKNRFVREDYKRLEQVPRGEKFQIYKFDVGACKQYDNEGNLIEEPEVPLYTLITKYKIGAMNYYTFLPSDYQNTDQAEVQQMAETFNAGLTTGTPLYLCYYGKSGSRHVLDILEKNEEPDKGLLQSCAKQAGFDPSPSQYNSSPKKPRHN